MEDADLEYPEIKRGLGLSFKFSLAVIILIGVIMTLVTWVVQNRVQEVLLAQMRSKGMTVARGLAGNAGEALAAADRLVLAELVDKAARQEPGIRLAALVDTQNLVLAHTDFRQEGKVYGNAGLSGRATSGEVMEQYDLDGEPCLDFTVPIRLEGKGNQEVKWLGSAHVVYLLAPLREAIRRTLSTLLVIALGGMVLGTVVTIFLVHRITSPVLRLAKAAEAVGEGNLDGKVDIHSRDELGQLAATFNQMTANLKQAQADLIVKERLQHEMEMAREIQGILIPKAAPALAGYSLGMLYLGCEEVSGDYLDFINVGRGCWGMVVADVSGKGVPGGLVMAQFRSTLRSLALGTSSPGKVLAQTQEKLHGDMRPDMFVTVSYLVLDVSQHSLTITRAGHPAALLYRHTTGTCELLAPSGVALGIAEPAIFESFLGEKKVRLEPGDLLLIYTDGVDESCNNQQVLFGNRRLVQCLQQEAALPADQIIGRIRATIDNFIQGAPQHDDMTMIVLKRELN
jgi:serine phosphatase RsbU (regulator of sigma subunit)